MTFSPWPYEGKRVIVLSATLKQIPPGFEGRIEVVNDRPEALAASLEAEGVRRVYLDGGITIQGFLQAGLVCDILITRIPVLIGQGRPIFGPLEKDIALEHLRTTSYPNGFVQSVYRPA